MSQLDNAFTLFLSLLVEAIPFLLLGVLLSSGLTLFLDERQLIKKLPQHPILGAFTGSLIGFFFPVCECGNVPVARRFLLQGLPTSVAIGFLFAAPTINPIVLWSTYVAFRDQPEIVGFRFLFSFIIATTMGIIFSLQKDPRPMLKPLLAKRLTNSRVYCDLNQENNNDNLEEVQAKPMLLQSGTFLLGENKNQPLKMDQTLLEKTSQKKSAKAKLSVFLDNVFYELRELGGVLILGSAIAASIQVFAPRELILNLGQGTISSIIAMMVLAAVVSICSTVDSFFALSFASTFTSSSLLAFLVFGPIIDIKAIGLMLSIFRPKIIFYLFILAAQLTFILTLSYSFFS